MSAGILVTGATGYGGGRLLRRLEEGGHAVRCLAREPARLGTRGHARKRSRVTASTRRHSILRWPAWIRPGRAWLEFEVTALDGDVRSSIRQTATFDPRALPGRACWYALVPVHGLLFQGMLDRIARRGEAPAVA